MNKILRHPATNAIGISLFSTFYAVIFLGFSGLITSQTGQSSNPFWAAWDGFLNAGGHQYMACILVTLTAVAVAILLLMHTPYDEYHTTILVKCLALSVIVTLAAIAVFFLVVLFDPVGIISKFTLFITMNWATVVIADLAYLFLCRRR